MSERDEIREEWLTRGADVTYFREVHAVFAHETGTDDGRWNVLPVWNPDILRGES